MSLKSWFERTFPQYEPPLGAAIGDHPISAGAARAYMRNNGSKPYPPRDKIARAKPLEANIGRNMNTALRLNVAPSREEFAAWRDDPTTLFVMAALRNAAAVQKQAWEDESWHAGVADQRALTEYRTRADAYESMEQADYDAFCEWAGVEPEPLPKTEPEMVQF